MSETTTEEAAPMVAKAIKWPEELWALVERAAKARGHISVSDFVRVTMSDKAREVLEREPRAAAGGA